MQSNKKNVLANIYKKLLGTNSVSEETRSLKQVWTRSCMMYELCKFCKGIIDNYLPFRSILSGINTPACELTNSFVLFSISNEYTVKY